MEKTIITKSAQETKKLAANLACQIFHCPKLSLGQGAGVIGLIGDLGSGKTTFTQGFAKGLGVKGNISSPTFVLEKIYELSGKNHRHLIHIDAYRIEKPKELIELGFKNLIRDSRNIILIEWADKIKKILPKNCVKIFFSHKGKETREIRINTPIFLWRQLI